MTDEHGNSSVTLNKDIKAQRSVQFIIGSDYTFRAFNRPFKKEEKGLEDAILTALKEMIGEEPGTIEKALERHYRRELLDIWLRYEGLIGYTGEILHVMEALGYDIDTEE